MTLLERFNSKWQLDSNGCWIWTACVGKRGYGLLNVDRKGMGAHRISYELFVGPISGGLHVLHRCDVRACVNPQHLFLGTNLDNIIDSMEKGRRKGVTRDQSSRIGTKYGPQSLRAIVNRQRKLPHEIKILIRRELARGWTTRKAAAIHQCSCAAISRVGAHIL